MRRKVNTLAEVKMRYNEETEEVELVVDNEVALSSGNEVLQSWVNAYNNAHPPTAPEPTEEEVLRQQVEDLETQLAIATAAAQQEEETPEPPAVDNDPDT